MFKKTGFSAHIQKAPELSALQQLLADALQNRGRQVQVVWRPPNAATFTLVLVCNIRGDPRWCLYRVEQQGKTADLLFDYSSCDVLLVKNLIGTAVAEPQKSVRSPFLTGKKANEPEVFPTVEEIDAAHLVATRNQTETASPRQPDSQALAAPKTTPAAAAPATAMSAESPAAAAPKTTSAPAVAPVTSMSVESPAAAAVPSTDVKRSAAPPELVLRQKTIDGAAIQSVMTTLRRTDTGMFMYPAFLYFLEQEFFRSLRTRVSLSVIVFDMKETMVLDGKMVARTLPNASLVEAVKRISTLKRHVDLLCHYEGGRYAILLPNTRTAGARTIAHRIASTLADTPLTNVREEGLSLCLGCASIPEDFVDLGKLLGAAELAMAQAKVKGTKFVMYSDIRENVKPPEPEPETSG